jgi:hypothetical protein
MCAQISCSLLSECRMPSPFEDRSALNFKNSVEPSYWDPTMITNGWLYVAKTTSRVGRWYYYDNPATRGSPLHIRTPSAWSGTMERRWHRITWLACLFRGNYSLRFFIPRFFFFK